MILSCPNCATRYQVDDEKFPPEGRQVRCAKCGHRWHQDPPSDAAEEDLLSQGNGDLADGALADGPLTGLDEPVTDGELSRSAADEAIASGPASGDDRLRRFADLRSADETPPLPPLARVIVIAGWAILIAAVLGLGWAAYVYRQNIMTNWPQSASLYTTLGLKSAIGAVKFEGTGSRQIVEDGKSVLVVSGTLTNYGEHEVLLPAIRVSLSDGAYRDVYHWSFQPRVLTLKPGESTRFENKLSGPPAAARHLELRFAKAGE